MSENIGSSLKYWVPGNPATFATSGEKPWKEALFARLPQCTLGLQASGLIIDFCLADLAPSGHPLDIDNLCEPVFSVLINKKGWFGGRRPNLTWWLASKRQGSPTGCRIEVSRNHQVPTAPHNGTPIFDTHYSGLLPINARDPCISKEIQYKFGKNEIPSEDRFYVFLRFDNVNLNIGDIATGKVKTTIDSLYPIVGGFSGQPEDWRIDILLVEKRINESTRTGVDIVIRTVD